MHITWLLAGDGGSDNPHEPLQDRGLGEAAEPLPVAVQKSKVKGGNHPSFFPRDLLKPAYSVKKVSLYPNRPRKASWLQPNKVQPSKLQPTQVKGLKAEGILLLMTPQALIERHGGIHWLASVVQKVLCRLLGRTITKGPVQHELCLLWYNMPGPAGATEARVLWYNQLYSRELR